jgi:hypothetical protein
MRKTNTMFGAVCLAVVLALTLMAGSSNAAEIRLALAVGNDEYKSGRLATPAEDAGLIADALTTAGFTVTAGVVWIRLRCGNRFANFLG